MEEGDLEVLEQGKVDYFAFSYYMSCPPKSVKQNATWTGGFAEG